MSDLPYPPPPPSPPPPPAPPDVPAPVAPPPFVAPGQPTAYWTAVPPRAARRSGPNLVVVLSAALAVVVMIVAVGGYLVVGNSYASARLSAAREAIGRTSQIDFSTLLGQTRGGFPASLVSFDAYGYQRSVKNFTDDIEKEAAQLVTERTSLRSAQHHLTDASWLTALNRSALDTESSRIDHALGALDKARAISSDLEEDGKFFSLHATALVDFEAYVAAGNAGDEAGAIAKVVQLRTDLATLLPLAGAPGFPAGVHDYVAALRTVIDDINTLINTSDPAAQTAVLDKVRTDGQALDAIDRSQFDSSIQAYYTPLIAAYRTGLDQALD